MGGVSRDMFTDCQRSGESSSASTEESRAELRRPRLGRIQVSMRVDARPVLLELYPPPRMTLAEPIYLSLFHLHLRVVVLTAPLALDRSFGMFFVTAYGNVQLLQS